jgi:hypothetical protein
VLAGLAVSLGGVVVPRPRRPKDRWADAECARRGGRLSPASGDLGSSCLRPHPNPGTFARRHCTVTLNRPASARGVAQMDQRGRKHPARLRPRGGWVRRGRRTGGGCRHPTGNQNGDGGPDAPDFASWRPPRGARPANGYRSPTCPVDSLGQTTGADRGSRGVCVLECERHENCIE